MSWKDGSDNKAQVRKNIPIMNNRIPYILLLLFVAVVTFCSCSSDSHKPRMLTLDSLSAYIGHKDYSSFLLWLKKSTHYNSSFFDAGQLVSSDLEQGDMVEIGWAPNRLLRLEYLGESTYHVLEAQNSKVEADDRFITGCFIKGQPLFLPFIERNGERTPPFVAGRNGGLSIVRKISKGEK